MFTDPVDLAMLGERIASVRKSYGECIDVPELERAEFATLLGVSPFAYDSYERGEREPAVHFLVALRKKTGVCLDWLLDPHQETTVRLSR
jgi:transcriptional regulator with XRE-family HTH domain